MTMSDPEWRVISWAPRYSVSSTGSVRKRVNVNHPERHQWSEMKGSLDKDGYVYLCLNKRKWLVHRLVYAVFVGPLRAGLVVCHLNGKPTDNFPQNLAQLTQRENIAHKEAHGTAQKGEKSGCALYTDAHVAEVKRAVAAAPRSITGRLARGTAPTLAARFAVSLTLIYDLSRNSDPGWQHV